MLTARGVRVRPIASLGCEHPGSPPVRRPDEDDTALLQLTSGSTAEPKAVRITHRNLYANLTAMISAARLAGSWM